MHVDQNLSIYPLPDFCLSKEKLSLRICSAQEMDLFDWLALPTLSNDENGAGTWQRIDSKDRDAGHNKS